MHPHQLTIPDTDSLEYARARYHYLLQIEFGETVAIDYCKTIADFAPSDESRKFLYQQQIEEERHLEMMTEYIGAHARPKVKISPYLKKMDEIMSDAINKKDYVECIFIQNFIVEGLNISLLRELEHHTDGVLSELVGKILKDEMGHMQFGVDEIKKILDKNKSKKLVKKLIWLQRKTLFYATGLAMQLGREADNLGIPMGEFAKTVVSDHFDRIRQAKFPLPWIDKIAFKLVVVFLKMI